MENVEYVKILIDCSFKESDAFWKRNAAFLVSQAAFAGLFLKDIDPGKSQSLLVLLAAVVGLTLSIAHLFVLRASEHYNMSWFRSAFEFVEKQVENQNGADEHWGHFKESLSKHLVAPNGHSTFWARVFPLVFIAVWIIAPLYVFFG